jgi:hypothetical protein
VFILFSFPAGRRPAQLRFSGSPPQSPYRP